MSFLNRVISRVFKANSKQSVRGSSLSVADEPPSSPSIFLAPHSDSGLLDTVSQTNRRRKQKPSDIPPILLLNIILRLQGVPARPRNALLARLLGTPGTRPTAAAAPDLDPGEPIDIDDMVVSFKAQPAPELQEHTSPHASIHSRSSMAAHCGSPQAPKNGYEVVSQQAQTLLHNQGQDTPELSLSANTIEIPTVNTPIDLVPLNTVPDDKNSRNNSMLARPTLPTCVSAQGGEATSPIYPLGLGATGAARTATVASLSNVLPATKPDGNNNNPEVVCVSPSDDLVLPEAPHADGARSEVNPSEQKPKANVDKPQPDTEKAGEHGRVLEHNGHKFTVISTLGYGGFGFVWHAIMETGMEVAIKVINKVLVFNHYMSQSCDPGNTKYYPAAAIQAAKGIWSEYTILEELAALDCPFLTPLLYAFTDEDSYYFVMRLYPQNLRQRLEDRTLPLQLWQTRMWAAELVLAMEKLHEQNIMHRDLKPDNIFISPSGHLCVGDFGISWQMQPRGSNAEFKSSKIMVVEGTPGYLAPEQLPTAEGRDKSTYGGYDYKVDMYSLGLVLLEMLTNDGRPWYRHIDPYFDANRMRAGWPRPEWNLRSVFDEDAVDLVEKLLSDDPCARPDWKEIREHPFFKYIHWPTVAERKYDTVYQACCSQRSRPHPDFMVEYQRRKIGPLFKKHKAYIKGEVKHLRAGLGLMPVAYDIPAEKLVDRRHGSSCLSEEIAPSTARCSDNASRTP
ncbi:kinase-like protein [Leucogyrophana mollusca]|uniref:Kinase-like protein n=1 Tax=Leucogyrophana mollusca TaxID=85980 RepID=A0ACB8C053_9AGAM|nr:kinase-like protein [Leucogyrophana mollusca]